MKSVDTSCITTSRLRRLRNDVPRDSVLVPMLFNIYIHDLPETTSWKFGYTDDLATMMRQTTWEAMGAGLNHDMETLAVDLGKWRLQLSIGKTVAAAYLVNKREARMELDAFINNKRLEFQ